MAAGSMAPSQGKPMSRTSRNERGPMVEHNSGHRVGEGGGGKEQGEEEEEEEGEGEGCVIHRSF